VADLTALKTRIASELHRSDLTTEIANAISTAIRLYRSKRFEVNEQQATFATVADQEAYTTATIPDDIGQIDSLRITVDDTRTVLGQKTFLDLQAMSTSATLTGQPSHWAFYMQKVFLYPIPDAAYTILVSYKQRKDEPSSDGDSSTIWTNQCEPLIRACAKKLICRDVMYDDAGYQRNKDAELEALSVLLDESIELQDEGGLRPNW